MPQSRTQTIMMMDLAQTLSWASSYYLSAVLAGPISRVVGVALLVAAAMGPVAGRLIGHLGGRSLATWKVRLAGVRHAWSERCCAWSWDCL